MDARAQREKELYNKKSIKRDLYLRIFRSSYYCRQYYREIIGSEIQAAHGKNVLEVGSNGFIGWLQSLDVFPGQLTCINISETELEYGKGLYEQNEVNFPVEFKIMDANSLEFEAESFDVVYGGGILHHLNFDVALREIHRVLKPNGKFIFHEPLLLNPFAALVRFLTPSARTPDERPLDKKDLAYVQEYFESDFYYNQFFSVFSAALTGFLHLSPQNGLDKLAFLLDRKISDVFPVINPYFREVVLCGTKREID